MLYYVEKESRLNFIAKMRSEKLVADIQQAASDAEASGESLMNDAASCCSGQQLIMWLHPAFQAINHCAKRVMVQSFVYLSQQTRLTACVGAAV